MSFIRHLTPHKIKGLVGWGMRNFEAPSPDFIKRAYLMSQGTSGAAWVETGTFLGETTRLLAKNAKMVYSLEPEPVLYANAKKNLMKFKNIEILNGASEDVFPFLLPKINGDINFWLDGHYSAGKTYKGANDTPILDELACIDANISHFKKIVVLVDDIRLFKGETHVYGTYPSVDVLVNWARQHGMNWTIAHDIFCAKN